MKKVIALILAVLMICSLAACDLGGASMEQLCGTWEMDLFQEADTCRSILEGYEFYEEEIALVDLNSMACVMIVEFNEDKTYRYGFDIDASRARLTEYFEGVMDALYNGRATLDALYEQDLAPMTEAEFGAFYAEVFGFTTEAELVDAFVENAVDFDLLAEDLEAGTFRIRLDQIIKTPNGKSEEEAMDFSIEGNTLTLTYSDGEEVYTKQ